MTTPSADGDGGSYLERDPQQVVWAIGDLGDLEEHHRNIHGRMAHMPTEDFERLQRAARTVVEAFENGLLVLNTPPAEATQETAQPGGPPPFRQP